MKNSRGMSLIEIIVSLGLLAGVVLGATTFLSTQQKEAKRIQLVFEMNNQNMIIKNRLMEKNDCEKNFASLDLVNIKQFNLPQIVNASGVKILDVNSGSKPRVKSIILEHVRDVNSTGLKEYKLTSTYMFSDRNRVKVIPIFLQSAAPNECVNSQIDDTSLARKMNCEDLGGEWKSNSCDMKGIKVGETIVCDASTEGTVRYNSAAGVLEFCDGSAWAPIASGNSSEPDNQKVSKKCIESGGTVVLDSSKAYGGGTPADGNIGGTGNVLCKFNQSSCPASWKQYSGYKATGGITLPCETKSFTRSCPCNGKNWTTSIPAKSFPIVIGPKSFGNRVPRLHQYSYYTMDDAALSALQNSASGKCSYSNSDNTCDPAFSKYEGDGISHEAEVKICNNQFTFKRSLRMKVTGDRQYCLGANGTYGSCPIITWYPWMYQFPDSIAFTKKTGNLPVTAVGCTLL